MDAIEKICHALCQSGRFETGQGTCAALCMDQLGSARKPRCPHETTVHGALADEIRKKLESERVEARRQAHKLWLFISDAYEAQVFDCGFADRAHDLIEEYRGKLND